MAADSAILVGRVTLYLPSVVHHSLHVSLCYMRQHLRSRGEFWSGIFSSLTSLLLSQHTLFPHFLFHLLHLTFFTLLLILVLPPAYLLAVFSHCSVSVVFSPHTHTHMLFAHFPLYIFLPLPASADESFSQCHHSPTGKVIPGCYLLPQSHFPNSATNWVSPMIKSITTFILEFNVP